MKKAVIIYNSKTGITRKYAEEMHNYLKSKAIDLHISSIQDYKPELLVNVDYVLLGCWTSGLFVVMQHPQKEWNEFAATLPNLPNAKMVLFTTYKLLTGTMFKNMAKQLGGRYTISATEFKSRNGLLSENDKKSLDVLIS
ncbi:MAG TPA: flavodoxin domain-containing protein [bacterium]|nr:flavodoxin domain-containing protein [bacterium]HPN42032.1 flavodoxin domain-containing protein [bacterium]